MTAPTPKLGGIMHYVSTWRSAKHRRVAVAAALMLAVQFPAPLTAEQTLPAVPQNAAPSIPPDSPLAKLPPELADAIRRNPRTCDGFLPAGTAFPKGLVDTLVSYRLGQDGMLHDPAIFRSSGNADLDKAAIACVGAFRYALQLVTTTPGDIGLTGTVLWTSQIHAFIPVERLDPPNSCHRTYYPPVAVRKHEEGATKISFRIAADGTTKDVTVAATSGFSELDDAAASCVATWRYYPATRNGEPIEIEQAVTVNWRMGH
jgi:TonB family protein